MRPEGRKWSAVGGCKRHPAVNEEWPVRNAPRGADCGRSAYFWFFS